jgi:uncharacterized membrane protein
MSAGSSMMGKGRLEAFSDGVLAVAITLLVLDLHVTEGDGNGSLWHQVHDEWPSFAAYVISFFVIGTIWVNHHALFVLIDRVDRSMLFYNLLLLFWVSTLPFTASALAEFLRDGSTNDVRVAVLLYGISNEGMAIAFALIVRHMLSVPLVNGPVTADARRKAVLRYGLGSLGYPLITVVGLFSAVLMLVLYLAMIIYYIADQTQLIPGARPVAEGVVDLDEDATSPG